MAKKKTSSRARSRPRALAKRGSPAREKKPARRSSKRARKGTAGGSKRKPNTRAATTLRAAAGGASASPRYPELLARAGAESRLRSKVLELAGEDREAERRALETRLGRATVARMLTTARATRGSDRRGKVVVLHGIMGSNLDSRDGDGSWDRVWIHAWRLFKGRIRDLELSEQGRPIPGRAEVRVRGLLDEYAPLVVELERRWEVLPFAYDWRVDIDRSADELARAVVDFARGEPVHLVAHSMGGLVARRFAQRHAEVWRAIDDPAGRARGGRLIQLGTPNRGSFAISLFLTGQDEIVKKLALVDLTQSRRALVRKLRGFAGSYQMLPPPDPSFGDERAKLHDARHWGEWPVVQALIDQGRRFQDEMLSVRDPDRLVYVAGYGQKTPYRVRVRGSGSFEYRITREGDGRVPHELGLLPDVRTAYVEESHGDLPKNGRVLDGIHDLLSTGTTAHLESSLAVRSKLRAAAPTRWLKADEVEPVEPELQDLLAAGAKRRGPRGEPHWTADEAVRIERSLAEGALGADGESGATTPADAEPARARRAPLPLDVRVIHADITRIAADLYAVGHYSGVLPQNAERALDVVISAPGAPEDERVLVRQTRRGMLSGELGQVHLFPWRSRPDRQVAIAGMGSQGAFGHAALRRVGQSLVSRALDLPGVDTLATVLIGSGEGNLPPEDAVRALLAGASDAIQHHKGETTLRRLVLVDRDEIKSRRILRALIRLRDDEEFSKVLELRLSPRGLQTGPGALDARKAALERVERELASVRLPADDESEELDQQAPSRISWTRSDSGLCVSALTSTAVVPERMQKIDLELLDELVLRMTDPEPEVAQRDGELLGRLVLPRDFRTHFGASRRLIVEVDRYTAGVHWEMLSLGTQVEQVAPPISTIVPVTRQLRTTYAPAPAFDESTDRPLRILVVGDPGDPSAGWDLLGARAEAIAVGKAIARMARQRDIPCEILSLVGAPSVERTGTLAALRPAGRLDVVDELTRGGWDLLHYCGHGDFDPRHPERVGWVFESGLLTSAELEKMDAAPRLVVANACLSARTSDRLAGSGKRSSEQRTEADLLPSLADEFFHRGVRNYVGTAWEVDDEGAVLFAERFYESLFEGNTLGRALLASRQELYRRRSQYGSLWAAYQHYGDPDERLRRPSRGSERSAPRRRASKSRTRR